ncbi:MAG: tetratricopeptide repeat protein, partial [Roseibium sp.]|nr:tetratricopeptide repeat protein [Roseibium sp.]
NILTDATALLFRAELLGLDVPVERWKRVADYALARFPKTGLAFADVHAAIAFARSGDREALESVIENARGPAGDLTRTLATGYR